MRRFIARADAAGKGGHRAAASRTGGRSNEQVVQAARALVPSQPRACRLKARMRVGRQLLYAAALSAIGLGVRSVAKGPVPLSVAAGATVGFSAIVLAGVLEPRLAMFADVVNRGAPSADRARVALTFDDGPSERSTPEILAQLDEAGVHATFFAIGRKLVGARATLLREAVARGHGVGCHSFAHDRLFAMRGEARVREDLRRALSTIEDAVGVRTRLFRPPIGHTNPTIARVARELSLTIVGFSVRGYDGFGSARADAVARRIVAGLSDGAIALLHDGAERDDFPPVAPRALPAILDAMRTRGLAGVTVDELLAEPPRPVALRA